MSNVERFWTSERIALLESLWMAGKSAGQVAQAIGGGATRNAIIGKIHRLGLVRDLPTKPGRGVVVRPAKADWTPDEDATLRRLFNDHRANLTISAMMDRSPWAVSRRIKYLGLKREHRPSRHTPEVAEANRVRFRSEGRAAADRVAAFADATDAVPLMSRKAGMCAWPVGIPDRPANQLCCGKTAEGSYCPAHRRLGTSGDTFTQRDMTRLIRRFAA
ncbi:MAG: GcrA family cell cycle regulator [Brevundimonas sp.]|uniref:GcrA family cell cycle regulator n=1 Tax=Brevundimonas sp. TaxID=1871086 RepID=UPI00391D4E69